MEDNVSERLGAWKFLLFLLSVVALTGGETFVIPLIGVMISYYPFLETRVLLSLFLLILFIIVLIIIIYVVISSMWKNLLGVFQSRLRTRKKQAKDKRVNEAVARHFVWGGLFFALTGATAIFTFVRCLQLIGVPSGLQSPPDLVSAFIVVLLLWLFGGVFVRTGGIWP